MPGFCADVTCFHFAEEPSLHCEKHGSSSGDLVFGLNGTKVSLSPSDPSLALTLNEFIRRKTNFKGTKLSCGQGGCGACTVMESRTVVGADGRSSVVHRTVNSCLRPVATLNGAAITTVEGLGSQATGYHPVQQRLAAFNGTQCGYCSPGMVMAIYGNLKALGDANDMAQLEGIFDGNICRCTGYRPILDAAKSFAKDSDVRDHINDTKIEAYDTGKDPAFPAFLGDYKQQQLRLSTQSPAGKPLTWFQPLTLDQAFQALQSSESARVVGANTAVGIYQSDKEANRVLVDVSRVSELLGTATSATHLEVGASTTLEDFVRALNAQPAPASGARNNFTQLGIQVRQIANIHVRNVGTVAGNLTMAKTKGFLSDLATSLLAADALVELAVSTTSRRTIPLLTYLEEKWNRVEIVTRVLVPLFGDNEVLATYKCSVRPQNAHAYVNAGFKFTLSADGTSIQSAICAYGGVQEPDVPTSHAVRAKNTEAALAGQSLSLDTLKAALGMLEKEIVPRNCHQTEAFSSRLVANFFYKAFLLAIEEGAKKGGAAAPGPLRSATKLSARGVTHARQSFDTVSTHTPVHQPIAKIEGLQQCSGEARFVDDIPSVEGTLHAAFVHAPVGHATIRGIDSSAALAIRGVRGVYTAADMGTNSWDLPGFCPPDEVLAKDKVIYHNQPVALIVADNADIARSAAKLVKLDLESLPVHTTLESCLADSKFSEYPCKMSIPMAGNAKPLDTDVKIVKGTVTMGTQKHFYMETQTVYVIPDDDDRFVIHCSLQCPGPAQAVVSKALSIPFNKINMTHRRSGGAFGGKAMHPIPILISVTSAAQRLKRPIRLTLTREEDMWLCGGREEILSNYQVSFDDNGKILGLRHDGHLSGGGSLGISGFVPFLHNRSLHEVYYIPDFASTTETLRSNLCPRTACRGPGEMSASVCMETMIEHVAHATKLSPETVRERNFYPDEMAEKKSPSGEELLNYTINTMWTSLKQKVDFDRRKAAVEAFNQENRWRKRGLSITPVGYNVAQGAKSASISIYADGSVLITHTGTEMGQGLNTKAAQVAAHTLGTIFGKPLDVNNIKFNDSNTYAFSANDVTGGSTGSEGTCAAVGMCCKQLVATLEGCKKELDAAAESKNEEAKEPSSLDWFKLVGAAHARNLGLTATARFGTVASEKLSYHNYGLCCSEVEVDILTGETAILSSYIIYDCGQSLNPAIDIGQCEGAFIMGVGHLLREKEVVEEDTGRMVSDNTWGYKVPLACDIPQQFHVDFLQNAAFDKGYLSSKASGEPPLVLATSVYTAVRQAVQSARQDAGNDEFFFLPVPATPEVIQSACLVESAQLVV